MDNQDSTPWADPEQQARAHGDIAALLPAYAGGRLAAPGVAVVAQHLDVCPACARELALWRASAQLLAQSTPATEPPAHVLAAVLRRISQDEARQGAVALHEDFDARTAARTAPPHVGYRVRPLSSALVSVRAVWHVVRAQVRLTRASTWLASAFVMALGWLVAVGMPGGAADARVVLQLVAPVVAACGVSAIYESGTDPLLEVVQATPASPRLLLLARLAVVFGYDLLLALAATLGLAALRHAGGAANPWGLVQDWLGPMLFLATLALVLAQHLGPSAAISGCLLLWGARVAFVANDHLGLLSGQLAQLLQVPAAVWSTNGLTLLGASALLVVALVAVRLEGQRHVIAWRRQGA